MSFVCDERFKDITYQLYYLFRSFFFFQTYVIRFADFTLIFLATYLWRIQYFVR